MALIVFVYLVVVLVTGVPTLFRGDIGLGLSGILAPFLAMVAGGGITTQKLDVGKVSPGVVGVSLIILGLAVWWTLRTGWTVRFESVEVSGPILCVIGYVVGLLFGRGKYE